LLRIYFDAVEDNAHYWQNVRASSLPSLVTSHNLLKPLNTNYFFHIFKDIKRASWGGYNKALLDCSSVSFIFVSHHGVDKVDETVDD
jgi:hypothetical protein